MFEQVQAAGEVTVLETDLSTQYINLGLRDKREGHVLGEVAVILTLELWRTLNAHLRGLARKHLAP